jgi:hypothetical protein
MTTNHRPEILLHPTHGELPARRVLDCIFALLPDGPILHRHIEDVAVTDATAAIRYTLHETPPAEARAQCRVIPPRVREFLRGG